MADDKQVEHETFHDPRTREGGEVYDDGVEFEEFDTPKPMTGDNPLDDEEGTA